MTEIEQDGEHLRVTLTVPASDVTTGYREIRWFRLPAEVDAFLRSKNRPLLAEILAPFLA